jgi:chemotaxis family two-component system sensor histidine kinase/response regulator PixL
MITDNEIREQGYAYFLAEAPELLQIIEQDLFTLAENYSIAKVHNLMRATHTIKGGAANVGLDTINKIAHALEEVFKSLYNPDVVIDLELQSLLLESYECLQLSLTSELTGTHINQEELLQRATHVFTQIQTKLGDAFGAEAHIPTSEELGFDIVQSIFEVGVKERIDSLVAAIENQVSEAELTELLRSQVEVFVGLAESLGLPGFGELAQTINLALDANPHLIQEIASIALADLQQAQQLILAGDRTSGGSPSPTLQALTTLATKETSNLPPASSLVTVAPTATSLTTINKTLATTFFSITSEFYHFLTTANQPNHEPLKPANAKFYLKVIRYIFGWFNHYRNIPVTGLSLNLLIPQIYTEETNNYIQDWVNEFIEFVEEEEDSHSLCLYRRGVILIILLSLANYQYHLEAEHIHFSIVDYLKQQIRKLGKEYKSYSPITEVEKNWLDSPKLQALLILKEVIDSPLEINNDNLLESIWGGATFDETEEISTAENLTSEKSEDIHNDNYLESITSSVVSEQAFTDNSEASNRPDHNVAINPAIEEKSPSSTHKHARQPSFVRVDVEGLHRLNYLTGELLIYQKRRSLYDEQILELIERLSQQLNRHQSTLQALREIPLQGNNLNTVSPTQKVAAVLFDELEMDSYTEFNLTLHEATEETLQLQETAESLELLVQQAQQISDKKQTLTLNIIDNLVEARMLPLGTILNRFPQMVSKLGNVYSKLVELKLTGTQVLVDKAIAEKLYDPLLHLVRNAFDHGIELPHIRRERGKSEQGTIEICAYNQGSQTVIEIHDDGEGLNFENIRQRAIKLNLITNDQDGRSYGHHPTESELIELMFSPGFSTAGQVSEISGRGMGLDIVRTQLQSLNGSISVQSSLHQGTTFILKIPFSMTTDKLMLVQCGGVVYALLQDSIEKILIPSNQQIQEFEEKQVLLWHNGEDEQMVGLVKLSALIYYNGAISGSSNIHHITNNAETGLMKNPVILIRRNQSLMALEVDQIIGEQELVIRPLGSAMIPPKYVYGCSSLASGSLILVIDGTLLVESQEMQATLDVRELPSANKATLAIAEEENSPLPLLSASPTPEKTPTPLNLPSNINSKSPQVLLVVDDAISLRQTLSLTLQKSGYQVLQAQNGIEALEQLQLHPEIEVVISDLEMPRMNGFELLSNIRQNADFSKKPVVILTSRSAEKHRQLAHALGANAYFTKPYLEHEFLASVDNLVKKIQ